MAKAKASAARSVFFKWMSRWIESAD
jgi:hypothetical protein